MPDENGKKLQDLIVQGITLAVLSVVAGGGASYLRPGTTDPQIAVLQQRVDHLHSEMIVAETELAKQRMEIGTLKGRVDMIGALQMRSMGLP